VRVRSGAPRCRFTPPSLSLGPPLLHVLPPPPLSLSLLRARRTQAIEARNKRAKSERDAAAPPEPIPDARAALQLVAVGHGPPRPTQGFGGAPSERRGPGSRLHKAPSVRAVGGWLRCADAQTCICTPPLRSGGPVQRTPTSQAPAPTTAPTTPNHLNQAPAPTTSSGGPLGARVGGAGLARGCAAVHAPASRVGLRAAWAGGGGGGHSATRPCAVWRWGAGWRRA
jgi:hypothetical protein